MRIRFYFDEDAQDVDVIEALRLRGVDVVSANEAGMGGRADTDHLAFATAQGRVLYSFNVRDYRALHTARLAQGVSHAGIILAPQKRYGVGEQMRRMLRLVRTVSAEEMRDRVEFLNAWG